MVAQSALVARCQRRAPPSFTNAPPSTHSPTAAASSGGAADARGDAPGARSAAARKADESVKRAGAGGASSGGGVVAIIEPAGKVDCEVQCVCVSVCVQSPHSTVLVCVPLCAVESQSYPSRAHLWCFQHFFITLRRLQPDHNPVFIVFLDGKYVVTAQARHVNQLDHRMHERTHARVPLRFLVLMIKFRDL